MASAVSGLVAPPAHGGAAGGETDRGHPVLKRGAGRDEAPQARADQRMGGEAPRPRNVGHPGPLAERVHAVPHRDHGRVRASRRRDGHHLQEPPDGRLGVWPQHRRVLHRPSPRPGDVRLPRRADRPRERQGPHHPDDRGLPAPPAVHDGLRGRCLQPAHQPAVHADLPRLVRFRLAAREQAHPHPHPRRAGQVQEPEKRGIVRVAGGEAHDDMADPAQGRENLDPDHRGRPDLEGAHRGSGCPLRFLGALPALRLFPAHGFRAHRMARKG